MSQTRRQNFTEENLSLTREMVQAFLDQGRRRDPQGRRLEKSRKKPEDLRTELKTKGHRDAEIDKVIGDWDSYL